VHGPRPPHREGQAFRVDQALGTSSDSGPFLAMQFLHYSILVPPPFPFHRLPNRFDDASVSLPLCLLVHLYAILNQVVADQSENEKLTVPNRRTVPGSVQTPRAND